jgi:hypothetical protein
VRPKTFCWELTGGVVSGDGCGGAGVLAAAPTVSLDGEVAGDVRLSESVLGMFSSTSSASWSCCYGRMERRCCGYSGQKSFGPCGSAREGKR